jgi:hypothetical protein
VDNYEVVPLQTNFPDIPGDQLARNSIVEPAAGELPVIAF